MAGMGQRFVREGYTNPKPLIEVDGKPILEHISGLFPGDHTFIFIGNDIYLQNEKFRNAIVSAKPGAKIISIPSHHLGPVHTINEVAEHLDESQPSVVVYCDILVHWDFKNFEKHVTENNFDSCLVCFKGFHPPLIKEGFYGTVRTEDDLHALEVREKHSFTPNKMDSWNSAGIYYFKSGALLKKYLQKVIDTAEVVNGEYYISQTHNHMIQDGLKNGIYPVEYFVSWGNPQDLREYEYWSKHFNKAV